MNYIDKIIRNIKTQYNHMIAVYNIEPNKIILGKKIFNILEAEARIWRCPEDRIIKTIMGLPIIVDYENIYTIEVCFELEETARYFESPIY